MMQCRYKFLTLEIVFVIDYGNQILAPFFLNNNKIALFMLFSKRGVQVFCFINSKYTRDNKNFGFSILPNSERNSSYLW